ncbi:4-methylaminobutanoate oxidase (formaldehyde-forming) [Tamaricihabitans halophyticus]|uniref:4-methylaminobutanoate oxidase (Formaldehyde-forming) n=1 Tax=Tamaricihabitans halophyticus TaxID=1262583 RepID=A0A4V2SV24_9PSEU|nr:FAD-dependent oxidoreductase [Tamaricihabitans halophyticus]TCP56836.1 4-methylaminobutanoate oxidase (formaldehyde-forming) [Tamaricihabitans halophyticus]
MSQQDTPTKELPDSARIVIVGGGVAGASIAYHLAELGERDVLLVDRDELTSGSTFHSAGLVGQLRSDPTLTKMNMYSVELYRKLQAGDNPPSWVECGGIRLASSEERLAEIRRQIGWAETFGLPLEEISVDRVREMFPLMNPEGVLGAAYLPTDGYIDPSQLCYALAAEARALGVRIRTKTRVLGFGTDKGRVTQVRTDRGDIDCEFVVNCGGMFAAEIGRMLGVRIPLVPMSHQYLVTEAFLEPTEKPLPTLRDPDLLVYYRQEVRGLVMGGYERDARAWTASERSFDAIPADFNGKLLGEDWERFEEITENSQIRVPAMGDVGIRKLINGPEAFTPDNEFCLGETEIGGFFVAAGLCAHGIAGAGGIGKVMAEWIVGGEPELDVWHMDISRFGTYYRSPSYTLARITENYESYYDIKYPNHERSAGRPLRTSPAYAWHREHGAFFGEKAGWERVNYYQGNADAGDETLRPRGWAGQNWSPAIGAEHLGTRRAAGLFDESSFSKISVSGPDSARFLNWVCDNSVARKVGAVTYTQALNSRGGIECDFTVTRTGDEEFLVVTGTAFGSHDMAWLRKQARRGDAAVRIADVTGLYACYALWGPLARDILGELTPADLSNSAFRFMTSQEISVADIPVRALRVTFTGELGWELYTSTEYGLALWQALYAAGEPHGMITGGYRAIDSMRVEKGYRSWGADIGADTTPYEAGLDFCVKLDKPGGFVGKQALLDAGAPKRKLVCVRLSDPRSIVLGNEPLRVAGEVVGRVTSGGYGYSVQSSIAFGYLPVEHAEPGTAVEIDIFGRWVPGTIATEPLFDPEFARVRG